tara:strand:+ start:1827 stop:3329 length:1503 start_codon:yes stop_codon:yes gene_type:complete
MENTSDQIAFDHQAEENIIVALLHDSQNVPRIIPALKPEDFHNEVYGIIYGAIVALCGDGSKATSAALTHYLREKGDRLAPLIIDMRNGGSGVENFLFMYSRNAADTYNIDYYLKKIKLCALKRALLFEAQRLEMVCRNIKSTKPDISSLIAGMTLLAAESEKVEMLDLKHSIKSVVADPANEGTLRAKPGISCGVPEWEELTGGLRNSSVNVIAARPSVGKSTLAPIFAEGIVDETGLPVIFFSLEMAVDNWSWREFARRSGITEKQLRLRSNNGLSDFDKAVIADAVDSVPENKYLIVDNPNLTMDHISGISKAQKVEGGLGGIMIDYLQLIKSEEKSRSRHEEVGDISGQMKKLAKELDIPIIALGQLNRSGDAWAPKSSQMSQSDKICHDADTVTLIHRKEDEPVKIITGMSKTELQEARDAAEQHNRVLDADNSEELVLTIDKARDGQRGVVTVEHKKGLFRITSARSKTEVVTEKKNTNQEDAPQYNESENTHE